MKFELEIADCTIPEGFKPVRVGQPQPGESFVVSQGVATMVGDPKDIKGIYLIVEPQWTWPGWLTCNYIAINGSDGQWFSYSAEPLLVVRFNKWMATQGSVAVPMSSINQELLPAVPAGASRMFKNPAIQ